MEHIFDDARKLAAVIRESGPYREYHAARNDVNARPALSSLLSEYQRLVRELAHAEDRNEPDLLPYRQRVSAAYFAAASDRRLLRFLEAERAVVSLVCDVMDIVAGDDIQVEI
ncbi:MAG: YlbF family regulator [Defluviitaleaceae bacterium]|nr:YlbF family regulator [Defluviitaleaceae bacterium]MCL2835453.1 YlbF family regulator [Defluviitaleaceae bacterium]